MAIWRAGSDETKGDVIGCVRCQDSRQRAEWLRDDVPGEPEAPITTRALSGRDGNFVSKS